MPRGAFKDLWDTVQRGRTWTGLIKNRAKNGDYYWVRANVTPVPLANGDVEYMSVRTEPSEAEKRSASDLYAQVQAGQVEIPSSSEAGSFWSAERLFVFGHAGIAVLAGLAMTSMAIGASAIWSIALLGLTAGVAVGIAILSHRHVIRPLRAAAAKLQQFVAGEYFDWAEADEGGAVGAIQQAIRSTQIKLGFEVTDARRRANCRGVP